MKPLLFVHFMTFVILSFSLEAKINRVKVDPYKETIQKEERFKEEKLKTDLEIIYEKKQLAEALKEEKPQWAKRQPNSVSESQSSAPDFLINFSLSFFGFSLLFMLYWIFKKRDPVLYKE